MKKRNVGLIMGAIALAGLGTQGQIEQGSSKVQSVQENYKATPQKKQLKQRISINNTTGGLDFGMGNPFGLTPKEYGIRFGHGNAKGKSNRLRFAHNSKLKRRINNA